MYDGIIIDAATSTVTEITIPEKDGALNEALGCGNALEGVVVGKNNMIYADGQGLLKPLARKALGFTLGRLTLSGKAIILGFDPDTGENTSCSLTVEFVKENIKWVRWDGTKRAFVDR